MKDKEIKVGDVVFLKGEVAQSMTVIDSDGPSLVCAYFDAEGFLRRETIRPEALIKRQP